MSLGGGCPCQKASTAAVRKVSRWPCCWAQVALTVKAGTIALTHYDLWHSASPNTSKKNKARNRRVEFRILEDEKLPGEK